MSDDIPSESKQVELSAYLPRIAKQTGSVLIIKVSGFFLGFVLNYVLAKHFGATILGQYELVLSVVTLGGVFSSFGFDVGLMKYVPLFNTPELREKRKYVISLAIKFGAYFALGGGLLILLSRDYITNSLFHDPTLSKPLVYGAFALVPLTLVKIIGGLYKSLKHADKFVFADEILRKLILAVTLIGLATFDLKSAFYAVLAFIFAKVVVAALLVQRLSRLKVRIGDLLGTSSTEDSASLNLTEKQQIKSDLLRFSGTMILTVGMTALLVRVDSVMLGYFGDASDVGVYKIVLTVASLITFIQVASNSVFPPVIAELVHSNRFEDLEVIYSAITKWTIVLCLPVFLSICFFSETILGFFGEDYLAGKTALIALALGFVINISVGSVGYLLRMSDHERMVILNGAGMGLCNIVLNFLLIPKMGVTGAALATAISMALVTIAATLEVKYFLGIQPYRKHFLLLLLPILAIVATCFFFTTRIDTVVGVAMITVVNMSIMVAGTLLFRDSVDAVVLNKLKSRMTKKH